MKILIDGSESVLGNEVQKVIEAIAGKEGIELQTSGTTGAPRKITSDLAKALARKRSGQKADRFILTYSPVRWAGVSVILHCYSIDCELIVPLSVMPADIVDACIKHQPTHISMTPSMLRNLIVYDGETRLATVPFRQVTFGGEAATQSVLNLAKKIWPAARITHTYASTEHGDICAVSDGIEGIPKSKFATFTFVGGSRDGELVIANRPTGDIWRLQGERYYFVGRKEEIINVGGNKVAPLSVEEVALQCGAQMARAYGVSSPVLGSLVALDYVGDISPGALRKAMSNLLAKYACPARVNRLEKLPLSDAGKLRRLL